MTITTFQLVADLLHLASFFFLIYRLYKTKSAVGTSAAWFTVRAWQFSAQSDVVAGAV
jgi:hypothetical protein